LKALLCAVSAIRVNKENNVVADKGALGQTFNLAKVREELEKGYNVAPEDVISNWQYF
jgi:hypothetical protein